jgi:hypothetical protein
MQTIKYLIPLALIPVTLAAQSPEKKWIPIEPINRNEASHTDTNKSKLQSGTKIIQNLSVIKNLLDHINKESQPVQNAKSWYSFEPSDND